jgi:RNA polymerase sigma-70 factor (ECF subfamily)
METLSEKNADFRADPADGGWSSQLKITEILLAELGRLKRIIAGMGLDASDSADVLQDVSIRALKQAKTFESRQAGVRWLIKVAVNGCLMEHRRRRSFLRQAPEILKRRPQVEAASRGAAEKVIVAEELEIVRESLRELDDSLLGPMVLRYFCDLDSKEVGEVLGLNASTVRSRLREARMILAKRLLERGVEP